MSANISQTLNKWYRGNARDLPWRNQTGAYAIWVSEVMLQQTRVDTVIPYYIEWMKRFPAVQALANATTQDVLRVWEGLGYYSRAHNLHKAARIIIEEHGGRLPENTKDLIKLPGIGEYTAGAIASIAFEKKVAAVDANVSRLMARLFHIGEEYGSTQFKQTVRDRAVSILPDTNIGDHTQAVMEFGAMICIPKNPNCNACPLVSDCSAFNAGKQNHIPVKKALKKPPHFTVTAGVISSGDNVLIAQRNENDLLGGLWEFPGGKVEDGETLEECLQRELLEELKIKVIVKDKIGVFKHAYTHFSIKLHAFHCEIYDGQPTAIDHNAIEWVQKIGLPLYPMGKVDRLIANILQQVI